MKYKIVLIIILMFSFNALYSQFGKNKVQYDDFEWKYIETEHFDIYYSNGAKHLAEYAAYSAEEALVSISATLNYAITKRINLIIYNSHNEFQQTNTVYSYLNEGIGGVTESMKNRIVLPFQGDYRKFKHVIHHELVHGVINDMFLGGTMMTSVRAGRNYQLPLFMNEGFAEWESIGGLNTETDVFIRDMALNDNDYLDLKYLNGYLAYRGGQAFYDYVATKYGKEKIRELITKSRIFGSTEEAFKSAFNISMDDFSDQWKNELKKFYWPDITLYENPADFATRLTNHKKERISYYTSPAISPNGEKVAFISDLDGNYDIHILDINKKETKKIISSFRQEDFEQLNVLTPGISWNPEGTKLVISAKSGPEDALFFVNASNGDYKKIKFNLKSIASVNWSPDGNNIAFSGTKNGQSDIYVFSFYTNNFELITNDIYSDFNPVWTADSKKLFFISDRGDVIGNANSIKDKKIWKHNVKQSDIYSIDLKSRNIERITNEPYYDKTSVIVSPEMNKILYISDKNGIGNIYNMDLQTGKIFPVTNSLNSITQMSITPNATKLVFCSMINVGYDLFLLNNPFTIKAKTDTLPITRLRKREDDKLSLENIISDLKSDKKKPDLKGYGDFELDMNKQQIVKINPDVNKMTKSIVPAIPMDTNFLEHDYKINFSLDYVIGNPYYSTFYGAGGYMQLLFSDVLGNHQIVAGANLLLDLKNSDFNFSYLYLENKVDWEFSAFHYSNMFRTYNEVLQYPYTRFRNWGFGVKARLPFNTFSRIEGGLTFLSLSKEYVEYTDIPMVNRLQFVPEFGFVYDDVFWGMYAPRKGTRFNINLKGTPKLFNDAISFATVKTDFRQYYSLFSDYLTLAYRGTAGMSLGPNPMKFYLGGTENWINSRFSSDVLPINEPEDYAFMNFEMPLRGFAVNEIRGTKFFAGNFELRFPLFTALVAGPVPILLQGVMGSLFFDIGGAWSGDFSNFKSTTIDFDGNTIPNDLRMSAGVGVRTYMFGLPIKLDIAWRNEYRIWSDPNYIWSIGYDF